MKTPEDIKESMQCGIDNAFEVYDYECGCVSNVVCDITVDDLKESLSYIQQLEAKVPRWISVEERLPDGICIAVNDIGSMIIGYIVEDKRSYTGYSCEDEQFYMPYITHWMPLPEPPVEV